MPVLDSLDHQRLVTALRRVQHHLDHTVYVSVSGPQSRHPKPELLGHGGSHLVDVEHFALNPAARHNACSERFNSHIVACVKTERIHPAQKKALVMPD